MTGNPPKILVDKKSYFVIDKPSGWIVNDAKTVGNQKVLQRWLEKLDYPISKSKEFRSGIVHRLDKETSGVLIVAKTKASFEKLQAEFKERRVEKKYIALVHGKLKGEGNLEIKIGRLPWNRERFGVYPGGRDSVTFYEAASYYKNDSEVYTLVEFRPKTGRTHQIRVVAKYLGHPIVSDSFYAGRKVSRNDRLWCPRLFLHAKEIKFLSPSTEKMIIVKSHLPHDLEKPLDTLEKLPQTI